MSLDEIKRMVAELSSDQLADFREWFRKLDLDHWDQQIVQDIDNGKLERMCQDSLHDFRDGKTKLL
jgi:hypothetical protein